MPLAAKGEFALVKEHMGYAFVKPLDPAKWGSNGSPLDLSAISAEAATRERDEKGLREHASVLEDLATREEHRLYIAISDRAWGVAHSLAGEYDAAESRLNRALEIFQSLETRWQIGRTLAELGELERSRGNISRARDYFSRALVEFEVMRAAPDATAVHVRMQDLKDSSVATSASSE